MSLVLLDTSVLIDAERADGAIDRLLADDDQPAIAAITVAELGVGVSIAKGKRRQQRSAFFEDVVAMLPVLAYDLDVALVHRELLVASRSAGAPRGAHDLIIAATARSHGRLVVTSDVAGFADLPGVSVR